LLVCGDCDVNARDNYGYTALMTAAEYEHKETCELLIKSIPEIKLEDDEKEMIVGNGWNYMLELHALQRRKHLLAIWCE
jgi:hypothetical protein